MTRYEITRLPHSKQHGGQASLPEPALSEAKVVARNDRLLDCEKPVNDRS